MRVVDSIATAIKDIRRQKARSFLTIAALTISSLILVAMTAMSLGGQQAITKQFGNNDTLTTVTVTPNQTGTVTGPFGSVQQVNTRTSKLDDQAVGQLLTIPRLTSAAARAHLWELHHFVIEGSDKQFVAQAEATPYDAKLALKSGTTFAATDKNVVIIGATYAKELSLAPEALVGKTVTLTTQKGYRGEGAVIPNPTATRDMLEAYNNTETALRAKIIGVTADGVNQNSLFLPLSWGRAIRTASYYEGPTLKTVDQLANDGYSSVQVTVDAMANVAEVTKGIEALGYGQISTLEQIRQLQQFSTLVFVILGAVALIAVTAAALGVANTMLMAVSEQKVDIGIWRAVGARRTMIIRMFLMQAVVLGVIGGSLGVGLGYIVSGYINDYVVHLLISQGLASVTVAHIPWWLAIFTVLTATLFAILAGLYPAYKAAKVDPSTALRSGQ